MKVTLFTLLITFHLAYKSIESFKYIIERSPLTALDTIDLSLIGDSNAKCTINLLTYFKDTLTYEPVLANNQKETKVSCEGLYTFNPAEPKDIYYVRVNSTNSEFFLTLRNIFEKPLLAQVALDEENIKFETIKLCSGKSVCRITENSIPIKLMPEDVECHQFGAISTEFLSTKDRFKLFCGDEQSPLYLYTKNTHLLKKEGAKHYSVNVAKGNPNTNLEVHFTNSDSNEMCEFQVRVGTSGNDWLKYCGLPNGSNKCFRPCNNVTMKMTTRIDDNSEYTLRIKNKYMPGYYENNFKIGKSEVTLEDITKTSVKVLLDSLNEANHHCQLKLYYVELPGYEMTHICGEDGKQRCDANCSAKNLTNLLPNTRYRLDVERKAGYQLSVSFRTMAAEFLHLLAEPGLNSVVIKPDNGSLAERTNCMLFIQDEEGGPFHHARCLYSDRCFNTCGSTFEVIGLKQGHLYTMKVVSHALFTEHSFYIKTKNYLDDYNVELVRLAGNQLNVKVHTKNNLDSDCDYLLYSLNTKGTALQLVAQCDYTTHCSVKCANGFLIDNKSAHNIAQFTVRPRHFGVGKTFMLKSSTGRYVNINVASNNDPQISNDYLHDRIQKYDDQLSDAVDSNRPVSLTMDETNIYDMNNLRAHKRNTRFDDGVILMDPNHPANLLNEREASKEHIPRQSLPVVPGEGKISGEKANNTILEVWGITENTGNDKVVVGGANSASAVGGTASFTNHKITLIILGVISGILLLLLVGLVIMKLKKDPVYAVAQIPS